MGTIEANISFQADLNNQAKADFKTIKALFDLCNLPTLDKIKDIKIDFWKDQSHDDVVLSMRFRGWISSWHVSSGYGNNHVLAVSLQPEIDPQHMLKLDIGN